MRKKGLVLLITASIALITNTDTAFAYPWGQETAKGLPPLLSSPLFGADITSEVSSSWNEPRPGGVHKGVDQSVPYVNVGAVWGPSRVLRNHDTEEGGGLSQVLRSYNRETGTPFYTVYFHLQKYLLPEGTEIKESDFTAVTGDTGSPYAPHLHYEVVSTFNEQLPTGDALVARVSVNPANYMDNGISNQRTVFKNYTVENLGGLSRRLHIDAVDYNIGKPHELQEVKLYVRKRGGTWQGPLKMKTGGAGHWTFDVTGTSGVTYEYVFAGRRNSKEIWVTYPAKYSPETGNHPNGIPINRYTGWDTVSITF